MSLQELPVVVKSSGGNLSPRTDSSETSGDSLLMGVSLVLVVLGVLGLLFLVLTGPSGLFSRV